MLQFNFENALMHFRRTEAPKGFAWKYLLCFSFISIGFFAIYLTALAGYWVPALFRYEFNLWNAAFLLLFLVPPFLISGIFEASYQRRYVHLDTFRLRIGSDELRLMVVYLTWLAFYFVMYMLTIVAITFGAHIGDTFSVIAGVIVGVVWLYLAVRFSSAAALTVRDRKIRFASSWRVTRGRFWQLLAAHFLLIVLLLVAYFVVIFVVQLFLGVNISGGAVFSGPLVLSSSSLLVLVTWGLIYLLILGVGAYFQCIWAGPAALAAYTDPDYAGHADPASVFT